MKPELPIKFEERMRNMLGEEFEAYLDSYQNTRQFGLRINPLKITKEELEDGSGFHLSEIPWTETGYFYIGTDHFRPHLCPSAGVGRGAGM